MNKVLVIMGTAPCLGADLEKLAELKPGMCDYMAAGKDAAARHVDYVVTGHAEDIPAIKKITDAKIIHYEFAPGVDIVQSWDISPPSGSSAHLGSLAGISLGYKKIILCGCPLQGANPGHPGADYSMFQKRWLLTYLEFIPFVCSMSGFTKDLLGMPTEEWLNNGN